MFLSYYACTNFLLNNGGDITLHDSKKGVSIFKEKMLFFCAGSMSDHAYKDLKAGLQKRIKED